MHLVPWWNPKLLNKFLPRVPECCYCNLATFFLEPSASQGVQAQGHVFCPELQLRNNTTGKSSDHQKKKKKKSSKQNSRPLLTLQPEQFQHQRADWNQSGMQGWRIHLEMRTRLGGAGAVSLCQLGSPLGHDKCSWRSSTFFTKSQSFGKSVLYDFHKGCRYKQT